MRWLAALRVMLFHMVDWKKHGPGPLASAALPVSVGYFFVSSGFLLTLRHAPRSDTGRLEARVFWKRRARRLLPLYYTALLLALPLLFKNPGDASWPGMLAVLTLTQSWFPGEALTWLAPAWALSVFAFLYLVLPGLLRFTRGMRPGRLLALAFGAWLVPVVAGILYQVVHPDGLEVVDAHTHVTWLQVLRYNPLLHLPEFLIGVAAARWVGQGGGLGGRTALLAQGVAAAGIVTVHALAPWIPLPLVACGQMAPLLVLLVLGLASGEGLARPLSTPLLARLGQSSYYLYLLHVPLWRLGLWAAPGDLSGSRPFRFGLALLVIAASVAVYQVLEGGRGRGEASAGGAGSAGAAE